MSYSVAICYSECCAYVNDIELILVLQKILGEGKIITILLTVMIVWNRKYCLSPPGEEDKNTQYIPDFPVKCFWL